MQDKIKIGDKEVLGRAIYTKKNITGTEDITWMDFFDDRLYSDLSVDRLGVNNIQKSNIRYLRPRAEQRKSYFKGWATINSKEMHRFSLFAYEDPVTGKPEELENNIYHAQIFREGCPDKVAARRFAAILKLCTQGFHEVTNQSEKKQSNIFARILLFIRNYKRK